MIISDITEMTLMTVLKRGVPNEECIAIQINENINLGQYGIMLGVYSKQNGAYPVNDNLFWFGDACINKDDWVFIYTGIGEPSKVIMPDESNTFSIFWGKPKTIFADTNVVPLLFRIDAVDVLLPPENLPQIQEIE